MPDQQHQKLESDPQQAMSPSMANAILEALSRLQNEQPSQNGAHAAMTDSFNNSVAEFEQGTAVDGGELLGLAAEDDEYVGDESEVDETVDGVGGDVFRQQPTEHNVGQQQSTNNMEAGKDWVTSVNSVLFGIKSLLSSQPHCRFSARSRSAHFLLNFLSLRLFLQWSTYFHATCSF